MIRILFILFISVQIYAADFIEPVILDDDGRYLSISTILDSKFYEYGRNVSGSAEVNLVSPCAVQCHMDGRVFTADYYGKRVVVFSRDGSFETQIVIPGKMSANPLAVEVSEQNIYISDNLSRISVFNSDYSFQRFLGKSLGVGKGEFDSPSGLFYYPYKKMLYVADTFNDRIQVFDIKGNLKTIISGNYRATEWEYRDVGEKSFLEKEQIQSPGGIAVDRNGNIYVANTRKNRVLKYSEDGTFLFSIGASGSKEGYFYSPTGIDIDIRGNIYVADMFNNRIQKFSSSGKFIVSIGTKGSGRGEFFLPADVSVARNGDIYVADSGNNRIVSFCADYFKLGIEAYSAELYAKACYYFTREALNNPQNANAYFYMGYCFYRSMDAKKGSQDEKEYKATCLKNAYASYMKAVKISPNSRAGAYAAQHLKRIQRWYNLTEEQ